MTSISVCHPLQQVLREFDIAGLPIESNSNDPSANREHIMLTDLIMTRDHGHMILKGTVLRPEGGSTQQFVRGLFPTTPDAKIGKDELMIAWEGFGELPMLPKQALLWNLKNVFHEWRVDQADYLFDSASLFLPVKTSPNPCLHIFETFAGGFGGWKAAGEIIAKNHDLPMQFVSMDVDFAAIKSFTMNHPCTIIDGTWRLPYDALLGTDENIILLADVTSTDWWEAMTHWNVDILTISAPCPPWSGASSGAGLFSSEGLLLPHGIMLLRILRPHVVVVEQVNGFGSHEQKQLVLDCFRHVGYRLRWYRILDASVFGGAHRKRWLGLARRIHDEHTAFQHMQLWPSVPQMTPALIEAIIEDDRIDVHALRLSEEIMNLASTFDFVPSFNKSRLREATPMQILESRCAEPTHVASTFMARYGSQHKMAQRTLQEKGYLAHFLCFSGDGSHSATRHYHPLEISMIHLCHEKHFVPSDLVEGWAQVGNCICVPHSLLMLSNAINCFVHIEDLDVEQLFRFLFTERLHARHLLELEHSIGSLYIDPRIVSMTQQHDLTVMLDHMQTLCQAFQQGSLPPCWVWTPKKGLQSYSDWKNPESAELMHSQITADEDMDVDITATVAFNPVLKAQLNLQQGQLFMWVTSGINVPALCELFQLPLSARNQADNEHGISFVFDADNTINVYNAPWLTQVGLSSGLITVVHDEVMIVAAFDAAGSLSDEAVRFLQGLGDSEWFDQFGGVSDPPVLRMNVAFFGEPIQHVALTTQPFFLLAAAQQTNVGAVWDVTNAGLTFRITGEAVAVEVIKQLWKGCMHEDTMAMLQQECTELSMEGSATLSFKAKPATFLIPCEILKECLQITAARSILDAIHVAGGIPVIVKWQARILWKGNCEQQTTVEILLALLDAVFTPFKGDQQVRLICQGRVRYAVPLAELMRPSSSDPVILHVEFGTAGGTGSKDNLRVHVKNAIAATLLEHGFPFEWTGETVESLLKATGTKHLSQIVAMPPGHARLEQILQTCKNTSITIPDRVVQDASKVSGKGSQVRDRKRMVVQPNPQHYQIEVSYLRNEDGSTPSQIPEIAAHQTGIALLSYQQAMHWIKEERLLSKDELTIAIVGHHELPTKLETMRCSLPCTDQNQRPVIIAATLCQLGAKQIRPISNSKQVDEKSCQTLALTMWKDDWSEGEWSRALDHTFSFLKQQLMGHSMDKMIEAMWGRSIRSAQKHRSTNLHAVSIQVHVAVQQDKVSDFLRNTGFCKVYATPKGNDGRVTPTWRVIWVEGDRARLHSLATQTESCAGLVRNQNSWGLRYHSQDFQKAWSVINGDKEMPNDIHIRHLFRVEPLPFGCTSEMLLAWGKVLSWNFRAVKALGPRSWLLGSDCHPPEGIHTFNANPVLIKLVPPRGVQETSPILAGPRPSLTAAASPAASKGADPLIDPWAPAAAQRHAAPTGPPRTLQGPIETRFQSHDEKFSKIEQVIDQLQKDQVQLRAETERGFAKVEQQERQLHQAIGQVRSDLEQSFKGAIAQQSTQLNSTLDDLKQLLLARPTPERNLQAGEDEEMSPH
eukprot:Skav223000  [mRNA]  locus=scaffold1827:470051:474715:- [translate_table: standard]